MKKKSCIRLILILIIISIIISIFHSYNKKLSLGTKICNYALIPFENLNNYYKNYKVETLNRKISTNYILTLRQENTKLRIENQQLKQEANKSQTLEKLLDFKKTIRFKTKGAHILYQSPNHWYNKAYIDLGEKDNIKIGYAVVNQDGLIGQICNIGPFSSEISSITNDNTAIGGINSNNVKGLVLGDGSSNLSLSYIKLDSNLKIGDIIYTYGDNSLIPSGIPIGKVISIKQDKITSSLNGKLEPVSTLNDSDLLLVLIPDKK